ncbi:hypothetical protein ACFO0N_21100 [Halobium salinum]|uniref:DUF35 domain-containing protein n=1 Tax=Halobium salinum TaxID=1364940 RepID=A0ABD5PI49_9EURY|nr:hypothetical protein [Halobium salinum]
MSFDPGTRNDASHTPTADLESDLRCYECGHDYTYLGTGSHPGRCPSCDGRVVTFAGEPQAVTPRTAGTEGETTRLSPLFKITVHDATDRQFEYFVAYPEAGADRRPVPILRYVRVGDHRVHATADHWDDRLVPQCVLHLVRELTGDGLLVPAERSSGNRDRDDDDGGIGVRRDP